MPPSNTLEELRRQYLSGRDPLAYVPYAAQLIEEKQISQALDVCLRGIEMRPSLAGRRILAQVYFEMGRYQDCQKMLAQVLEAAPESFAALLLLAQTHERCGRREEAATLLHQLKENNGRDERVKELEEKLTEESRWSEQPTPMESEPSAAPLSRKEIVCEQLSKQPGMGLCYFQRPVEGNVLETANIETLYGMILEKAGRITEALQLGTFQELMMEYERGYVMARRMGEEFLIAQFAPDQTTPGQIRQSINSYQ